MEPVKARPLNHASREERAKVLASNPDLYKPGVKRANPKKLWDNYQEIAIIQKTDRLRYVVAACTREGYRCVNIREFYYVKRDNAWKPGRDGIMIPLASPLGKTWTPDPSKPPRMIYPMQEMLLALEQAAAIAAEMDLEDKENEVWLLPKVKMEETK